MIAKHSGKAMVVAGASQADGANVFQYTYSDDSTLNYEWVIEPVGNYYRITARHSGKSLDVSGPSLDKGANIIQWPYHGGDNQLWSIIEVD